MSDRTTSMPMPRPEICVTLLAVENPGVKMHSISRASVGSTSRPDELFQHRTIEFDLRSADFKIGALVELLGCLAQDAIEPLGEAAERHRPNRE